MLMNPFANRPVKLAVLGLGYVGLPLAVAFAEHVDVVGFDISADRVSELSGGSDRTLEVSADELKAARRLTFSSNPDDLRDCNVLIVTVPTPIDAHKRPDLSA